MTDKKLQDELERLRNEVNKVTTNDLATKEKLNSIINDIEQKFDIPDDEEHHKNLIQSIKEGISQFETEHPRATAILNDIMVTLSNMGI